MPELDPRLQQDCHWLGRIGDSRLLLMDNSHYPWLILVPDTHCFELHQLPENEQINLLRTINQLARFVEQQFKTDKINTACIGNIVRQLHIHVVGRHQQDPAWPGVVWGHRERQSYRPEQVTAIYSQLQSSFGDDFVGQ